MLMHNNSAIMRESFLITYDYKPESGFDLAALGESFMGFDAVLKEILDIAHLTDKVEIRTTRVEHNSIDVYNAIQLTIDTMPFVNVQDFLEFLRIAAPELLNDANTFFSAIHGVHRTVNDYFARNPVDMGILGAIAGYIIGSIRVAGKLKKGTKLTKETEAASPRQVRRLRKMVEGGKYKRALSPIIEGSASRIKIAALDTLKEGVIISPSNVGEYLPEDAKILPDFANGSVHTLSGELLDLSSTRGDSVKIRINGIDPENSLLSGTAADGSSIEDYARFFKQEVTIEVEISRKTMYKRPELIIRKMDLRQQPLLPDD